VHIFLSGQEEMPCKANFIPTNMPIMMRPEKTAVLRSGALLAALCLILSSSLHAKVKMMRITPAKDKLEIKNYRIAKVVDERLDKTNIGYLTTGAHNFFLSANFSQPLTDEFNQFLAENTQQNNMAEAVELHVYDYFLHETSTFKGAEIALTTHYTLFNKDGHRLMDYSITETRNTGMNMSANAGELMRRNMLHYLSDMDNKLPAAFALYKSNQPVKVSYVFVKEPARKNLLPYNPQRPLNIYNFAGKAPAAAQGPSGAECGLIVNYQIRHSAEGKAEALIELLPYFDQAASWMKAGGDIRKSLEYEQTYFKISAYVTNELIKELQAKSFTFGTLKSDIDAMREKYVSRMRSLQQQYRAETANGSNPAALEKWKRQIAFYPAYASK